MTIITHILRQEHKEAGLYLKDDEDFVYLCRQCERTPLATFSARGVTIEEILHEADQVLEQIKSGVSFERVTK